MQAKREPAQELDELSHAVIGAAIEVHRNLGPGYLESVYEEAMAVELQLRGIPFTRQVKFSIEYKGHEVGCGCVDLLVAGGLIVELKAVDKLADVHQAQVISYLKALRKELGLIINFQQARVADGIRRAVPT